MAKKQVKVEIVGDNQQFNQSMDQASRRVRDFGRQAQTASSGAASFMGNIKSMTASLGLADTACKAVTAVMDKFNDAVLHSSQVLGDQLASSQMAANTAIDEFAYALVNCDFSNFTMGLDDLITRANEAYIALDQLGNSTMSLGVMQAKYGADMNASIANLRGLKKGTAEYAAELKNAETAIGKMKEGSEIVQGDIVKALQTQLSKDTGVKWDNIKLGDIEGVAMLDADKDRDEIKAKAAADYKAYQEELRKLQEQYGAKTRVVGSTSWGGSATVTDAGNPEKLAEGVARLNEQYKESILQNQMLNKYTDDELKNLDSQLSAYYNLNSQAAQYEGTLNRLRKGSEGGSSSTGEKFDLSAAMNEAALANAMTSVPQMIQEAIDNYGEPLITPEALMDPDVIIDEFGNVWAAVNEQTEDWLDGSVSGMDLLHKKAKLMNAEVSKMAGGWAGMGATFQAVGGMMDDSTGKALTGIGNVMTAVAQLIPKLLGEAVVTATGTVARTATTWYEIIPGIAAVTAAIYSAVAGFEEGGVIGGNSTTGDRLLIRANSGERVLTAEQNEWFETLANGGGQESVTSGGVEFRIKNNTLAGTLRNHERRTRYRYA